MSGGVARLLPTTVHTRTAVPPKVLHQVVVLVQALVLLWLCSSSSHQLMVGAEAGELNYTHKSGLADSFGEQQCSIVIVQVALSTVGTDSVGYSCAYLRQEN